MKKEGNAEGVGELFESEELDHDDGTQGHVTGEGEGEDAAIHANQRKRRRHERKQNRRHGTWSRARVKKEAE